MDSKDIKLRGLVERVIDHIGKEYMLKVISADKRVRTLTEQKIAATKAKQFFKAQLIDRQIHSRSDEIVLAEAGRRIQEMCNNGKIDGYLEEPDHDKIEALSAMMFIMFDAMDSVCIDSLAVYESYGIGPEELRIQRECRDFRDVLTKNMGRTKVADSAFEEIVRQEGDRLYEYIKKRQQVLFRKIERIKKPAKK